MLHLAVAAPPDKQTALKHDDDFGVANLDSAEIAFRIPPAFRQQPLPALTFASPEPRPGWVFAGPWPPRRRMASRLTSRHRPVKN